MENFLKNEDKYVQMMVEATTPIIRYVWGEHYGYFLCEHEPLQKNIKVMHTERQTFIGAVSYTHLTLPTICSV